MDYYAYEFKINLVDIKTQPYKLSLLLSKQETNYQSYILVNMITREIWIGLFSQEDLGFIRRVYQVKNKRVPIIFSRTNKGNRSDVELYRQHSFSVDNISNFLGWATIKGDGTLSILYNSKINESITKLTGIFP